MQGLRPITLLLLLVSCAGPITYACEPAGIDWPALYRDYDKNRNRFIEKAEWPLLIQLGNQPISWRKATSRRDPRRDHIFQELDRNHDQRLSQEEMNGIYVWLVDPCEGWPW